MAMRTALLLASLTCIGCSSQPVAEDAAPAAVAVTRNPNFTMPANASYELVAGVLELPADPKFDVEQIDGMVRAALMVGLDRRGYQLAGRGSSQLRVGYAVVHGDVVDDTQLARVFGISPGWRPQGGGTYQKGTIVLLVTDASGQRALWQGAIQGQVHREATEKERRERIQRAVERLLDQLR